MKWFNGDKGYGFFAAEAGPDVFVHFSAITGGGYRSLEEGQKVEFDITQARRAPRRKTSRSPADTSAASALQDAAQPPVPGGSARLSPGLPSASRSPSVAEPPVGQTPGAADTGGWSRLGAEQRWRSRRAVWGGQLAGTCVLLHADGGISLQGAGEAIRLAMVWPLARSLQ